MWAVDGFKCGLLDLLEGSCLCLSSLSLRQSLCSCGWPGTHSVNEARLNSQRSVSASLKVCAFFFFFVAQTKP